jgi:hypothetical protein
MQELNLRLGQAVSLTYAQEDENFKRLKTAIDALEVAVAVGGNGTVTTVGLALPNIFTVTNSPVTSAGTLTATLASQAANSFFVSPNGTSGTPTFRSLVSGDINFAIPVTKGGTGLSTIATANQVLSSNLAGGAYEGRTITPSGGLTVAFAANLITLGLNPALINITDFAGILTSTKGGTGFSGPFANNQILIGNGSSSWTSAVLTAGSGISITNGVGTVTIANSAAVVSQLNTLTGNVYIGFGSSGTDLNVTTPTTSDITLNIPSASASNRGVLTSADWTTFNSKVGGSGTTNYIPKFTASGTVGNSLLYELSSARIGLGTITPTSTFHILATAPSFLVETSSGTAATIRASSSAASTSATLNSGGNLTTVNTNFTVNTGLVVYPTGNTQITKGFALKGFEYWNTASNYFFPSNEMYGVVLGPTSPNTMSVALPTIPMDGQEICILCEETKVLTLTSTYTIFGHNAGVNIDVTITGGAGAGAAGVMVKFSTLANAAAGAWFITGL